jgi:hypothetical protein
MEVSAEIRNGHLPNTKQYRSSKLSRQYGQAVRLVTDHNIKIYVEMEVYLHLGI